MTTRYGVIIWNKEARLLVRVERMYKQRQAALKHAHKLNQMISIQVWGTAIVYDMVEQRAFEPVLMKAFEAVPTQAVGV